MTEGSAKEREKILSAAAMVAVYLPIVVNV